jgi:hypothetical protein
MRTLIILSLLFVSVLLRAQLSLSVNGGLNATNTHISQPLYGDSKSVSKPGWQAGLGIEYRFKNSGWLLYSALSFERKNISHKSGYDTTVYKPLFLTMPLGAGYSWAITPKTALRFYAGLYGALGGGGKFISDEVLLTPAWPVYEAYNRKISFGNTYANDITHFNWGAQFGIGLKTWQHFELACMYNLGVDNILPARREEKMQLRSISLDVKVDLKTFKPSKT